MESKLSFTTEELRPIILKLANLKGYEDPIGILDELKNRVLSFKDFEFTRSFFLNVHYLCQENAVLFWSKGHRESITKWLKKHGGISLRCLPSGNINLFDTTWEEKPVQENPSSMEQNYDNNYFNEAGFLLFDYLIENYKKDGSIKYINIYYFLKSIAAENDEYRFAVKINQYKELIQEKKGVTIGKFERAKYAYEEKEYPKLNDLEKAFRKLSK